MDDASFLAVERISKRFSGTLALAAVSLNVQAGEIHGLVGANGAGKSTLGKVLAGVVRPDSGTITLGGQRLSLKSPRDALRAGIARVGQEPTLVRTLTVEQNVFLGSEVTRLGSIVAQDLRRRFEALADSVGLNVKGSARVGDLSLAEQQRVEVLRALSRRAQLLIMDEPTAALSAAEIDRLLASTRLLNRAGVTIVYVSHELTEVMGLCKFVTVLRDGMVAERFESEKTDRSVIVRAMMGREVVSHRINPQSGSARREPELDVRELQTVSGAGPVSFQIRPGEVVALAGSPGSGKSSIGRALFGAERYHTGTITFKGSRKRRRSPTSAIADGIALVPQARGDALVMCRSGVENVSLPCLRSLSRAGVIRTSLERRKVQRVVDDLEVRGDMRAAVSTLSGGNQQKLIFGRWSLRSPRLLIVDEPTRGVDVGAREAIYKIVGALADEGVAVLLISMDVEDIMRLSDRYIIMRRGRNVGDYKRGEIDRTGILARMVGADE